MLSEEEKKKRRQLQVKKWNDKTKDRYREYKRLRYQKNKELLKERRRVLKLENPEKYKINMERYRSFKRRWLIEHKEKSKEYRRRWLENNKEKQNASREKWIARNPHRLKMLGRRRYNCKKFGHLGPEYVLLAEELYQTTKAAKEMKKHATEKNAKS